MGIIIKPIVTEKMTAMGEKYNRYGFRVDPKADKLQIKKAVEENRLIIANCHFDHSTGLVSLID